MRTHVGLARALGGGLFSPGQEILKLYANTVLYKPLYETLHETYAKLTRSLHEPYTKLTPNLHEAYARLTRSLQWG